MDFKRTKIVCTIGPASSSPEILRGLIAEGMDVARLNFSHGTYDEHAALIRDIRAASEALGRPVAILQDLQGPKIRVGALPKEGVRLEDGTRVTFTTGEADVATLRLPVTYERLHEDVKAGERILLDDGLLSATVIEVRGRDVLCEMVDGGLLTSHKGVNFPDSHLGVSSITEKDRADLAFGVAQGVDFVALSFVRTAAEVRELRGLIEAAEALPGFEGRHAAPIRIIAKIEKREGVENFASILEAVDAVMVARGDLGIETDAASVPVVQKMLVARCRAAAKPVIVATQMLDSMIRNPRPTRAEVSDVANAVIDHADAVMLSGETAGGKYPLESVATMARIVRATEASPYDDVRPAARRADGEADAWIAEALEASPDAKVVAVASPLGDLARAVSRFRPSAPILVASAEARVRRQLCLTWGAVPVALDAPHDAASFFAAAAQEAKRLGLAAAGDEAVLFGGEAAGAPEDRVEVRHLP